MQKTQMNQRIRLLKEQSMEWVPNMADPDTKIQLLNAEKFADMIVRECMDVVAKKCASPTAYNALVEHFGVRE